MWACSFFENNLWGREVGRSTKGECLSLLTRERLGETEINELHKPKSEGGVRVRVRVRAS